MIYVNESCDEDAKVNLMCVEHYLQLMNSTDWILLIEWHWFNLMQSKKKDQKWCFRMKKWNLINGRDQENNSKKILRIFLEWSIILNDSFIEKWFIKEQ